MDIVELYVIIDDFCKKFTSKEVYTKIFKALERQGFYK
ncbi:MAG: hypothetical protein K0R94_610 [Burkholderiales bacterium]|jgi:hypothetical protein|nr:hypothetical protein [Burkholderiales bacterium]